MPAAAPVAIDLPPIDFRAELNDEQFSAVTAPIGPMLVLAGAGSGKTRTLTYRVAYLLSQGLKPWDILLLTFTNKAAKEMLHRVSELTGVAATSFWGGTFHSIGHRLLRIHGESLGLTRNFTIMDQGESEKFLEDTIKVVHPGFFTDTVNPKAPVIHAIISLARNTMQPIGATLDRAFAQHANFAEEITGFAAAYQSRKLRQALVDYDDLLEYWLTLLRKNPDLLADLQKRFRYLLVDEYQDTNAIQSAIVDLMAGHHCVMAVGDDAQCIYTWRGAEVENILAFPQRHKGAAIYRIETNYRSTPEILEFANSVLQSQPKGRQFEKELRPARESGERPYYVTVNDTMAEAAWITGRVRALVEEGFSLSSIAILYRAHFHAIDIQMELARAGIPYSITSGVRFFEQAHTRDLIAMMRFVFNPGDVMAWLRIGVLLPKIGEKGARKLYDLALTKAGGDLRFVFEAMASLEIKGKVPKPARDDWDQLIASFRDMERAMQDSAPKDVVDVAISGWYEDFLVGEYTNYKERKDDLVSMIDFAGRFSSMDDFLGQVTLLTSESSDRAADPNADALRLSTVHQAKGLEYRAVFVLGVADGQFPGRRALESGDLEEERRLFYVAVTRAKDVLFVCYPRFNSKGNNGSLSPSRFMEEVPPERYQACVEEQSWSW
jgi:DNA helicase-2/ATP-dependent DNA helicase PcrA